MKEKTTLETLMEVLIRVGAMERLLIERGLTTTDDMEERVRQEADITMDAVLPDRKMQ